jgi:peptidoglycan/LPS O-acetylase OafA/YrhL
VYEGEKMKNQKIVNIRAIAIIIVVLGHSIILYSNSWGIYESIYNISFLNKLKEIINLIQMPIFFSISGYLFYYSINKKVTFVNFIKNKFKRLIIPFIFVGLFYMIPIKMLINYPGYNEHGYFYVIKNFFNGNDSGHLWYLPTLFLIFIIAKLIFVKTNNKNAIVYIILFFLSYLSIKLNINIYLKNTLINIIYFYTGLLINKYEDNIVRLNKKTIIILFAILVVISFIVKSSILTIVIGIVSILLIYLVVPSKKCKIVDKISKNSFGIYLFHSPLIYVTYSYLNNYYPIIVITLNFLIFGVISFYLTNIIRSTKLKMIIGE